MNNNFKIFFRKLIWISAAIYIGVVISFSGSKLIQVVYSHIKLADVSLASVYMGVSESLSFGAEAVVADVSTEANVDIMEQVIEEPVKEKEISFTFVGDIMLDRNVENSVYKNGDGDFSFIFENIDFLRKSDITFGNLEGPVSDKGKDLGNLYSFRMNPRVILSLKAIGFDVLSVANNHVADWGKDAFLDTLRRLKLSGIISVGGGVSEDDARSIKIIEKDGVKVGFIAFSDVGPKWFEARVDKSGILLAEINILKELVVAGKDKTDYLVVSFHFGNEYELSPSQRQEELAKAAIDAGADIVVGHHPHVVQKIELYHGGLIAYSLGNFIFDQSFSEETMEGAILNVAFKGGEIVSVYKKKVKLNEFFQVYLSDYDN